MKKTFLKIISLVLCALIALPCVPGALFTNNAYASDEIIALTPTDDTWTGDATAYVVSVQGVQVEGASSNDYQHIRAMGASAAGDLNTARYASAMSYMKFDMSDYTDVKIDSAKLKLYAHSSRDPENGVKLYFFKTDSNWSEDKLTYNVEAPIVPLKGSDLAIDVTGTNIESRIQPDLVSPSFNLVGSSSGFKLYEFDLTDLVKKYNLKSDSDMSFAFIAYPSPYAMMIASKDNENEEIRPTLEISTSPVESLEVVSSPAQEMLSTDDVTIEFNNILDASTVSVDTISLFEDGEKVDLTEEDFVINENVLTITKEKVPYCDYELVISEFVSDIYGNSLGSDLSFAFSCMPVNSSVTLTDIIQSAHLDPVSPNNTRMTTTPFYFYAGGNYYPYYVELDMSDYIGKNLSRVTYDIKFESVNQYFTVYFYDVDEDFDPETVTYATAPTLGDHLFSRFVGINSGTYVDFDLTSFVNEKLKTLSESDPYIRFALKPGASTTKLYSDFASNSNRPKITIEYTDSSYVGVKSTIPANDEVGFSVDADVVIEFSGSVDGADSSNFVLKNLDKNEEIVIDDSQITYDDSTNTVTISFPDSLDELTSYELTVSGITAGENVIRDKRIKFSTASRIDISDVTVSGTIDAGSIITASVDISNNTEVSSIGPALIAVLYDGKGKMLDSSVAGDDESISENEEKTLEASLTVPENITDVSKCYVKAFVWDKVSNQKVIKSVVLSGDEASADSMRGKFYGEITIEGNLSDSPDTDISLTVYDENNKICHYNQVVSDSEGNFAFPVMFDNSGKLDENDKIISIEYSSDQIMDLDSESKLYLVGKTEKSNTYTGTYKRYSKYFGPNIFVEPGQTLMFRYPIQSADGEITDEEDLYSVTSLNSVVSGTAYQNCAITGYSIDPNSKVARYITVEYEAESGAGNTVGGDTRIAMVGEVKKCVWRDEYVEAVTIYNSRSVSGTTVYGKNDNYFTNLGIESGDIIRVDYSGETKTVNAVEIIWENGSETLANGTYTFGSDGSICDVRFCKVYKNWGVVSDVFPKNTDLATVSSKDAKPVRTDLYMIFKYNKKLGKVETLNYRDIMAYEVAGEDASEIIYEMRYYDPMSMFVVK